MENCCHHRFANEIINMCFWKYCQRHPAMGMSSPVARRLCLFLPLGPLSSFIYPASEEGSVAAFSFYHCRFVVSECDDARRSRICERSWAVDLLSTAVLCTAPADNDRHRHPPTLQIPNEILCIFSSEKLVSMKCWSESRFFFIKPSMLLLTGLSSFSRRYLKFQWSTYGATNGVFLNISPFSSEALKPKISPNSVGCLNSTRKPWPLVFEHSMYCMQSLLRIPETFLPPVDTFENDQKHPFAME